MTKRLPLLVTNSSLTMFRRCPREYYYRYVLNRKGRRKAKALRFGTLFHLGLNAWWAAIFAHFGFSSTGASLDDRLTAALAAVHAGAEADETDEFDIVRAEVLLAGYTARWGTTFAARSTT